MPDQPNSYSQKSDGQMSQPPRDFILCTSQLGFRPDSPKPLTLIAPQDRKNLPDRIPFYIQRVGDRLVRNIPKPPNWSDKTFRWPFDPLDGKYAPGKQNYRSFRDRYLYEGQLKRIDSRWGTFWQGDFSEFKTEGIYQIETECQLTTPFLIEEKPYERLLRGFLIYLYSQRSGFDVPAIRPAMHLDDAVLDADGTQIPAAGGWYDAGDLRKWMAFTQSNLEGLCHIYKFAHPAFCEKVIDEIRWGNRFFHNMINEEGQVYEDVGGGQIKSGFKYEDGWWFENHPGCIADSSGCHLTDNIPNSGDERKVRTTYNPLCQFEFVRNQALVSKILPDSSAADCLRLAKLAWQYGQNHNTDRRTLFVAAELAAALDLFAADVSAVSTSRIQQFAEELLSRQDKGDTPLSHYFLEQDSRDGYRSFGFAATPPLALLRLCELDIERLKDTADRAAEAVRLYIENYLLKDAQSNPFAITPYGIYINPPHPDIQLFRDAGRARAVRTFTHPFNHQDIVHPCGAVWTSHAHLLARAGKLFAKKSYQDAAERLLQWQLGHNTVGLCLFTGVGFRHPIPFSAFNYKIPEACICGWIGRPDDTPYMETSNVIEWNTQEIWDVVYQHAIGAIVFLT